MTGLADRAHQLAGQHPPRTPGRRAAAMVYVALTTTKSTEAARKALGTFGDPGTAAARRLLEERPVPKRGLNYTSPPSPKGSCPMIGGNA
jgi:hypothetical protein